MIDHIRGLMKAFMPQIMTLIDPCKGQILWTYIDLECRETQATGYLCLFPDNQRWLNSQKRPITPTEESFQPGVVQRVHLSNRQTGGLEV